MDDASWRRCSTCREPIGFSADYWTCSVSTCNRPRASLVVCSVECWDGHLPIYRHREAWANESRSPTHAAWEAEQGLEKEKQQAREAREAAGSSGGGASRAAPQPRAVDAPRPTLASEPRRNDMSDAEKEVLVVVSKIKAYIRATAGMNTSDAASTVLSERVRGLCDAAIAKAKGEGRKTVLDRDF